MIPEFLDACPACPPGDAPAAPPLAPAEAANGGRVTTHQCAVCETAWSTFWREDWPIDRLLAPVAAERAEWNRAVLEKTLKRSAA